MSQKDKERRGALHADSEQMGRLPRDAQWAETANWRLSVVILRLLLAAIVPDFFVRDERLPCTLQASEYPHAKTKAAVMTG